MLDVAIGNCDRLSRLVNDILDFERIGSGRLHSLRATSAGDLLRRAADLQAQPPKPPCTSVSTPSP